MKRLDRLERLWETIEAHRLLPFRWGGRDDSHDCCTFVASCIDAMSGTRYVDALLEHYVDEPTAKAYIESGGGLAAVISSYLGEPKRIGFMGRGDAAIVVQGETELVGICIGDHVIAAGLKGLVQISRSLATAAWSV